MQEKLDALHGEKVRMEDTLAEIQVTLSQKDKAMKQLQESLASTVAQLAAFSKSMSSLQDDRHRVIEKAKIWQQKFGYALQRKEEIRLSLLNELNTVQQQYLLRNQDVTELRPLKAQLQEYREQTKPMQVMEELRRESLAWQHELHQLRMEKNTWELREKQMKEQYIMAIADKDQQLRHLQSLLRSSSQTQSLSAQYQRQLSQLLEEEKTLSVQLSDTSQSLHESQQYSSDLSKHCAVLEKQVQELQALYFYVGLLFPFGEMPPALLSEVQQQLGTTDQEMSALRRLLKEEREQRLVIENALSLAKEQIRRPGVALDGNGFCVHSAVSGPKCHYWQPYTS
ncbi:hypothetical protein U0070_020914 [Myodes glareolus]|uniref:Golgin subfamily A conserved domain-containing protein n=1 Tax=Myodes glareolus TaxID=447135 RepID=A0AAW0H6I3_MYOGA